MPLFRVWEIVDDKIDGTNYRDVQTSDAQRAAWLAYCESAGLMPDNGRGVTMGAYRVTESLYRVSVRRHDVRLARYQVYVMPQRVKR